MFATRSRRTASLTHAWTVVPFDARGGGMGDIPATVAIETPDDETVLIICTEAERDDGSAVNRCISALDAFRAGFDAARSHSLTASLLAGMESANDVLYIPYDPRTVHRPLGIGLSALAVRGAEGYLIQAGPGQALIVQAEEITALPPLDVYRMFAAGGTRDMSAHPTPLGTLPEVEPDLFHVDARSGLFAALCTTSLGRVLLRDDDTPLCDTDAPTAAEYLVDLGVRYRLPQAYGVLLTTERERAPRSHEEPVYAPPTPSDRWQEGAWEDLDQSPAYGSLPPYRDDGWGEDHDAEQQYDYLGEPQRTPRRAVRWPFFSRAARPSVAPWNGPYAPHARRGLPDLPPRVWMLLGAIALTLFLAAFVSIASKVGAHQANVATRRQLDLLAAEREQAMRQTDTQAAYTALTALNGQLDKIAADERQTQRVAQERQLLAQALDRAGNITRVMPKQIAMLTRADGGPGNRRIVVVGDSGVPYLYDRNEKGEWAVFSLDAAGKRTQLFGTGSVASKVPASDLRGLVGVGAPATTDRTRLFTRLDTGTWKETTLTGVSDRRPTALAVLGDALYLLDAGNGQITRASLKDATPAKVWTTDSTAAELRTAVDMTADGQVLWLLFADGHVRGFMPTNAQTGTPLPAIMPSLVPALSGPTAMTTNANSPYLYVAESGQDRILRIRKQDGKVVQVLRAGNAVALRGVQSITVNEAQGTLWLATADGVLTVSLPTLNGP